MQVLDILGRASETADGKGRNSNRSMLILLGTLLLLRLFVLFYVGPVHTFDSLGYILYGNLILHEREWLHSANLKAPPSRAPQLRDNLEPDVITTVRLPLYSAILALAKLMSKQYYDYIVCLSQICVASAAYATLFISARRSRVPIPAIWIGIFFYGVSASIVYDIMIMADSLFSSLLIIIVGILTYYLAAWERLPFWVALILGMLALLAVLLRDAGYPIIVAVAAFVLLSEAFKMRGLRGAGLVSALLVLPSVAGVETLKSWNEYRTGERFVTVLSTSLLRTVLYLELSGFAVLPEGAPRRALEDVIGTETRDGTCTVKGRTLAERALSHTGLRRLGFACAEAMHDVLLQKYELNNVEIGTMSRESLTRSVRSSPQGLAGYVLAESLSKAPVDIISFDHFFSLFTNQTFDQHISLRTIMKSLAKEPASIANIAGLFIELLSRTASVAFFLIFIIFLPIVLFLAVKRRRGLRPTEWCLALHLLVVCSFILGYSVILVETRYILAAHAFIVLDALFIVWVLKRSLLKVHDEPVAQ